MSDEVPSVEITVRVNGRDEMRRVEPRLLLVDFIRHELRLTGTHVGCETSYCGACTILLDGIPVKSCTLFAVQADGGEVRTVEGLETEEGLHPLQKSFAECHALQCGYCTPGLLMSSLHLLEHESNPDDDQIRKAIAGNVCRCTGYQNIIEAVRRAAGEDT